jgi:histidinol-phosphatase (PHP family)
MYLADYHTHSRRSPDAGTSMAEMARAAVEAGLDEICFTDHIEVMDWHTHGLRTAPYDWAALEREYQEALAALDGKITIRLGMELGEAPFDFAETEKMMASAPELDFVIGSVHALSPRYGHADLCFSTGLSEDECREQIRDYLELVLAAAKWGQFTVLGHLTLPLRYMNQNRTLPPVTFDGFESEVEEILRTLIQNGCGIELNTNRGHDPLPGEKWLRMYRELGGEIITLGSDAHSPRHVGCAIREGQALLRECGFTRFCTFEKKKPVFHSL